MGSGSQQPATPARGGTQAAEPAPAAPAPAATPAPAQPQYQAAQPPGVAVDLPAQPSGGMPAAPGGRDDELMTGGSKTVFEFSGVHAEGRKTFSDEAGLAVPVQEQERARPTSRTEHNLGSGSATWLLMFVAVLVIGGAVAFAFMRPPADPVEPPEVAPAVADEGPGDAKASPAKARGEDVQKGDAKGAQKDDTKAEAVDEAGDAKAADTPADEDGGKAPAKPAAPKAPAPKSGSGKSKPKPTPKKGSSKPKPKPKKKKGKVLKPKKPPREDDGFGNLPKPPG